MDRVCFLRAQDVQGPGLTLVPAFWLGWAGPDSGGPGARRAWGPWAAAAAAGLAGTTSGVNALLFVSKAAVGSGGTRRETVKVSEVGGCGIGKGGGSGGWNSLCCLCC